MAGQKLRGLVGQGVNGRRKVDAPVVYSFKRGVWSFIAPVSGWFQFAAWGGGGGGATGVAGGGSGALVSGIRALTKGQVVALTVAGDASENANGNVTTVAFSSNDVMSAGGGATGFTTGLGGAATSSNNLDSLVNGGNQSGGNGGIAPGFKNISATSATSNGLAERASGGSNSTATIRGAPGEVVIYQTRIRI